LEISGSNILVALAEVAIGFAGFSAVVAALFRRRRTGDMMPFDEVRFLVMLEFSLTVLVFSLLPLALDVLGLDESRAWRVASRLFAGFLIFHLIGDYFLTIKRKRVALQSIAWSIYIISTLGVAICTLALLLSSFGAQIGEPAGVYIMCLLWLIVLAATHFTRLAWLVASVSEQT
jgi:hypothetical protein